MISNAAVKTVLTFVSTCMSMSLGYVPVVELTGQRGESRFKFKDISYLVFRTGTILYCRQ